MNQTANSLELLRFFDELLDGIIGCNSFGPELIRSPDFWSPISCPYGQMVPKNLFPMDKWSPTNLVSLDKRSPSNLVSMDKWSTKIWSPWTNCPQPIWSPYFQIITACPPRQTEYSRDHLSRGTKLVGDHLSRGTKFWGIICPWGKNWLGTVCPEEPINWGPIVED